VIGVDQQDAMASLREKLRYGDGIRRLGDAALDVDEQ
jgi:hypothetical protein